MYVYRARGPSTLLLEMIHIMCLFMAITPSLPRPNKLNQQMTEKRDTYIVSNGKNGATNERHAQC